MSGSPKHRNAVYRLAVIGLLLLFGGCADNSGSGNSANDRNSGVYGGMTGGGIR